MSLSLVVTSVGALVAVAWTGVLAARVSRRPAGHLIAWTAALFGLSVGLGAQAMGYLLGYDAVIFRAMELGGQVLAPLAVSLGIAEVAVRRPAGRLAVRLAVGAVAVIGLAVLGTGPISAGAAPFGKAFPDPAAYYQHLPQILIAFILGPFAAITGLIGIGAGVARSRDAGRGGAALAPAVAGVAALLLAAPAIDLGLKLFAHITVALPMIKLFGPAYLLAAVLTWLAANQAASQEATAGYPDRDLDGEAERFGQAAGPGDHRGYGLASDGPDSGDRAAARYAGRAERLDGAGYIPAEGGRRYRPAAQAGGRYGQLELCTLVPERAGQFDRITERVIAEVRAAESGTLVFIAHELPGAPALRILYRVYRNEMAYEEHLRQPHMIRYARERRPLLLRSEIIELDHQRALVSPLPSLPDILAQAGIELASLARSGQRAPARGRPVPGYGERPVDGYADRPAASQTGPPAGPPGRGRPSGPYGASDPRLSGPAARAGGDGAVSPRPYRTGQPSTSGYPRPGRLMPPGPPAPPVRPSPSAQPPTAHFTEPAREPSGPGHLDQQVGARYPAPGNDLADQADPDRSGAGLPARPGPEPGASVYERQPGPEPGASVYERQPGPEPGASVYERQYEGWAEIRGEERGER